MATSFMSLDELVVQLRQVHGDLLEAVVLYGSAASDEQIKGHSDHNVLVIVQSLSVTTLQALSQTTRAWNEAGNSPPLTITRDEWTRSTDIFPMEYADILERHRVLYGSLPLDGIAVDRDDLRLQVEQEAMGKLLRLRRELQQSSGVVVDSSVPRIAVVDDASRERVWCNTVAIGLGNTANAVQK